MVDLITNRQVCARCGSYQNVGIVELKSGNKTVCTHIWCDNCNVDIVLECKPFNVTQNRLLSGKEIFEMHKAQNKD